MSEERPANPADGRLPATVIGLGVVSLLTDVSSEAIFPLLPAFLATLGASNTFIGLVEGLADVVANLLKYWTGAASDRRRKLKPWVLAGYGVSTLARPLVAFATAPWHVLVVRAGDRVGKGVRTSPRDALIAAVARPSERARAFGFHRAMDHTGAAIGTLLGALALYALGATHGGDSDVRAMRTVFELALIPGLLAMIALALVPEPTRPAPIAPADGAVAPAALPPALKRALVPITLFAFANATDAFILVRAARLGAPPVVAPLLWLVLHVVKATTATVGGRLADRYGKRNALALGWLVYSVTWSAVGLAPSVAFLFALVAVYGVSHGLVEGAEKGLIADLASEARRGSAFGAYNMLSGFASLAASLALGAAWDHFGAAAAFGGAGAAAALAAVLLVALVPARASSYR
ncbi:MAG: MFS transporter [Polyangiaceae bacterium]